MHRPEVGNHKRTRATDRTGFLVENDRPWTKLPAEEAASKTYFKELLIDVNMPLRFVPNPFTAAMIAIEMPAAISPYSMAVAPLSSARNFCNNCFNVASTQNRDEFDPTPLSCRAIPNLFERGLHKF